MATNTLETFTAFYGGWLLRDRQLQDQLSSVDNFKEEELNTLVQQVSDHYRQYYEEKSTAIEKDVFLISSPPWYTSFEKALFWMSEFRPSLLFRFIGDLNLTAEQARRVEMVRVEIVRKESEIGEAMTVVQESLAAWPLFELLNRTDRLVNGQVAKFDDAMEEVKEAMRVVVVEADGLRVTAVLEILEVLEVVKRVKFLAAVGKFRNRVREIGLLMEV